MATRFQVCRRKLNLRQLRRFRFYERKLGHQSFKFNFFPEKFSKNSSAYFLSFRTNFPLSFSRSLKSTKKTQLFCHFFMLFATFPTAQIQAAQFLCLFIRFCPIESLRVETQRNAFLLLLISSCVEKSFLLGIFHSLFIFF